MNRSVLPVSAVFVLIIATCIRGSGITIGAKGIDSVATVLDGTGSSIGQVEGGRPGLPGYDTDANCCNSFVVPVAVFAQDRDATANEGLDPPTNDHSLWVASVMISKQTTISPIGSSPPIGVAPQAELFSSAFIVQPVGNLQEDAAISAQALTPTVFATNMSFGLPTDGFLLDGSSTLTSFVDWSTVAQEVLYVVAGNELGSSGPVPTDNYNGITVAASGTAADGYFRKVSAVNVYDESVDASGTRTSTDILAPGELVDVADPNGSQPFPKTGTSLAAPHVTGTLALLQQRATTTNGNRHLTKKAVILNSADKIKGIIGMDRTVLKYTTGPESSAVNWFGTDAYSDAAIPVDREMGVGELDAKRAVQQFDGGEHGPGAVPTIGWDYDFQNDPFVPNRYTLSLNKGDFVSATLVWDRNVFLNFGSDTY